MEIKNFLDKTIIITLLKEPIKYPAKLKNILHSRVFEGMNFKFKELTCASFVAQCYSSCLACAGPWVQILTPQKQTPTTIKDKLCKLGM